MYYTKTTIRNQQKGVIISNVLLILYAICRPHNIYDASHTILMKSIVIVGGSSGIGLALVQNLMGNDITNISRTPCAVAGVNNLTCDVTDTARLEKTFAKIDRMDALVYCAGFSLAAPVEYTEAEDYRTLFDVNLFGAAECVKLAVPKLKNSEDGRIIILSSSAGIAPIAYDGFYSASKAGIISLCTTLRLELPQIKSTAVIVGGTQTMFSFKRKIYTDCGEYDKNLKTASDALIKIEQTGYSAEKTARAVKKIINDADPPLTVTVGAKNKLAMFAYKILPWRLKLYALRKTYGI